MAMPRHDNDTFGNDLFASEGQEGPDADDEVDPIDGYRRALIQGWTPVYPDDHKDNHKGDGRVRIGEEDPRCSVHVCRRLAVAINLGPKERSSNPGAVAACGKEWVKLKDNKCWDEYDVGQFPEIYKTMSRSA